MTADAPETTDTDTPEPETQQDNDEKSTSDTDRLPDDHPVVKALAKANKEAEQYRLKVKEFEDSQKTDLEKQAERLAELETTAKTSSLEAARLRVALRKGLTETQAKRLVGSTEEELEQDADELVATFALPTDDDGSTLTRRPQERLRPGATPSAEPKQSPEELVDAVIKRRGF